MFANPPTITDIGLTVLLRAAGGESFTLTKFQAGNGILQDGESPSDVTALRGLVLDNIPITDADDDVTGYLGLQAEFNNQQDFESFQWTELGLIAEDANGNEYLYAYAYDEAYSEPIGRGGSSLMIQQEINYSVPIGTSGNITADVSSGETYALRTDLEAHLADTNDPHSVTYAQIGAAAASHTHSALDIVSGILPISRGGTGVGSIAELDDFLQGKVIMGRFQGDDSTRKDITLGFKPSIVALWNETRQFSHEYSRTWAFWTNHNVFHQGCPSSFLTADADTVFNAGHGGGAVTNTGFAVGRPSGFFEHSDDLYYINRSDFDYFYLAMK